MGAFGLSAPITLDSFRQFSDGRWGPGAIRDEHSVTLYSPYDRIHQALVLGVGSVSSQLWVAMYGFNDDEVAGLIHSKMGDPGINCQITLDKSQAGGVHEKALLDKYGFLSELGNTVAIGTSEFGKIMHRKMLLIDGRFLITGSTNLGDDAETKQDNQLTITDHPDTIRVAQMVMALEHTKALHQCMQAAA